MRTLLIIFFAIFLSNAFGQANSDKEINKLYIQKKYKNVIEYQAKKNEEFSAKVLYTKAMAYYMLSDDKHAMTYFDLAIEKGPVDHDMYYYKGMLYYYDSKFEKSIVYFNMAIDLKSDETDFYSSKGESYYFLKNIDSAIVNLEKSTLYSDCEPRTYMNLGEIYLTQNSIDKALSAYSYALKKFDVTDESHQICSYNVGLIQQLMGNISEAKITFKSHIDNYPKDYHVMAKLIQAYYSQSAYDKAKPYKEKIYAAYREGLLNNEMQTMYCIDQFKWNGKSIMVFEYYEEPKDIMYVKCSFCLMNEEGEVEYKIELTSSKIIRNNDDGYKYILKKHKGEIRFIYGQYVFNNDYQYHELKKAVLDILSKKVEPRAVIIAPASR